MFPLPFAFKLTHSNSIFVEYSVRFLYLHTFQDDLIRVNDIFITLDINQFCVMIMLNLLYYLL